MKNGIAALCSHADIAEIIKPASRTDPGCLFVLSLPE